MQIKDFITATALALTDFLPLGQSANTRKTTLQDLKNLFLGTATLNTVDKTVNGAINENKANIGDLTTLTTTDKSNLVNAIKENTASLSDKVKQVDLNTTNTNLSNHLADLITDSDGAHGFKIETGTWTPVIKGNTTAGTNTYSDQAGRYIKQGKLITCWFRLSLATKDSNMAGNILIGGLPYVALNNNANRAGLNISGFSYATIPSGYNQIIGTGIPGDSTIALYAIGSNVANTPIIATHLTVASQVYGSITYETSV